MRKFFSGLFIVPAVLLLGVVLPFAAAADGGELLREAMRASRALAFEAVAEIPVPAYYVDDDHFGETRKIVYRQFCDADGFVYKRLEFFPGDRDVEVYVLNRAGQFGQAFGSTVRIEEAPILAIPDLLSLDLPAADWETGHFTLSDALYRGVPCYEVVVDVPHDRETFTRITGGNSTVLRQDPALIRRNRPFSRRFLIGKDDKLIYSRTHYSLSGKVLFSLELDEVKTDSAFAEEDFATPGKVIAYVPTPVQFVNRTYSIYEEEHRPSFGLRLGEWFGQLGRRFSFHADSLLHWGGICCAVLGVGLIAFVAVYKWSIRRKSHAGRHFRSRRH